MPPAKRSQVALLGTAAKAMPELSPGLMKHRAVYPSMPTPGVQSKQVLDEARGGERVCLLLGHLDAALLLWEIPRGAFLIPADVGRT